MGFRGQFARRSLPRVRIASPPPTNHRAKRMPPISLSSVAPVDRQLASCYEPSLIRRQVKYPVCDIFRLSQPTDWVKGGQPLTFGLAFTFTCGEFFDHWRPDVAGVYRINSDV